MCLHFPLLDLPKLYNYLLLVQIIIFLYAISLLVCNHLLFKNFTPHPCRYIHIWRKSCICVHIYIYITYLRTYLFTLWNRVIVSQLVKKFPAFHGTRRFITALTSVRLLSLSLGSSIRSIPKHPTSWRSILILSSHLRLGLPSSLFPRGFPTKTLYTPLPYPIRATCPAHTILLEYIYIYINVLMCASCMYVCVCVCVYTCTGH